MGNHCTEICHYISDTQVMAGTLVYFSLKSPCFLQTHAVSHYWLHVNDDSVFLSMKTWDYVWTAPMRGVAQSPQIQETKLIIYNALVRSWLVSFLAASGQEYRWRNR